MARHNAVGQGGDEGSEPLLRLDGQGVVEAEASRGSYLRAARSFVAPRVGRRSMPIRRVASVIFFLDQSERVSKLTQEMAVYGGLMISANRKALNETAWHNGAA